jgi:hypothetical protein
MHPSKFEFSWGGIMNHGTFRSKAFYTLITLAIVLTSRVLRADAVAPRILEWAKPMITPECMNMSTAHTLSFTKDDNIFHLKVAFDKGVSFNYGSDMDGIKGRVDGRFLGVSRTQLTVTHIPETKKRVWWWYETDKPAKDETVETPDRTIGLAKPEAALEKLYPLSELLLMVGENLKHESEGDQADLVLDCLSQRVGAVIERTAFVAERKLQLLHAAKQVSPEQNQAVGLNHQ